jgi:hypothetical protein
VHDLVDSLYLTAIEGVPAGSGTWKSMDAGFETIATFPSSLYNRLSYVAQHSVSDEELRMLYLLRICHPASGAASKLRKDLAIGKTHRQEVLAGGFLAFGAFS